MKTGVCLLYDLYSLIRYLHLRQMHSTAQVLRSYRLFNDNKPAVNWEQYYDPHLTFSRKYDTDKQDAVNVYKGNAPRRQ